MTPPPRISVPAWADRFRKLAAGAGSTSGDFRTSTVEAARGPMLAVTEPGVHVLTLMVWSPAIAALTPRDRLVDDGQQFDIRAIAELGKRAAIEVTAQARVD